MTIPVGLAAIVAFLVIAELGRALVAKLFGYSPERHVIPIMKLPGIRGNTGFRLTLILAGPVTTYLAVAILAFGFFKCHGTVSLDPPTEIGGTTEGGGAAGKLAAGDVITDVDGVAFGGGAAILSEQVNAKRGGPVAVTVLRDGTPRTVTITPKQADGRWLLGVRLEPRVDRSIGRALREAIAYPVNQSKETAIALIELVKGADEPEAGGPVRLVEEFRSAFEQTTGELILRLGMLFGVYTLIGLALFDLVRALFLILFRS